MRLLSLLTVLALAPLRGDAQAHIVPFPEADPIAHVIELAFGGAAGEALTVRVASAPGWLAFGTGEAASERDSVGVSVGRLAFTVTPDAPVDEAAVVEMVVVDAAGTERARHAVRLRVAAPELELSVPWPNPSRGGATVAWTQPAGAVRVSVVDMLGREVAVLADGDRPAGRHEARIGASDLAAGTYIVRVETGTERLVSRLTVVR